MKILDADLLQSLQSARDAGIAPVYFAWIEGRDRITGEARSLGFWTGDDDITVNVEAPSGGLSSKDYIGGCGLSVEGVQYVADLTDNQITVSLSQIADAAQQLVRGYDVRLAYVEIHATTWDGGVFSGVPQLQWVGVVDDAQIATPEVGGDGSITLSVRSELMAMLTDINPAKSSDAHQKRRRAGDKFSIYSGMIASRKVQWWKE